jgi:mono/diheme cytochrome c family protein
MKKLISMACMAFLAVTLTNCDGVHRNPGRAYMPDMSYSRAYETYAVRDSARFTTRDEDRGEGKIFYSARPVLGTMARGDAMPFGIAIDKPGDSTNYRLAKNVKNPFDSLDGGQMKEAERLYLVNCAICHGMKLDGNGPLYKDGTGPYSSKPATLAGDPKIAALADGEMFYTVTYGKNAMGSYASQITTKQRWMIIDYIRSKQAGSASAGAKKDSTAAKTTATPAATK